MLMNIPPALLLLVPVLLVLYSFLTAEQDQEPLIISTRTGILEGITVESSTGKSVDAYLGIPYAAPPTGKLRFKPPQDMLPWSDVLPARENRGSCLQIESEESKLSSVEWWVSDAPESEDCLHLNIWVPRPRPRNAAVLVWIHGGSLLHGSSAIDVYDGKELAAEEGIILVTLNYRLSIFGFLYLDHPDAPGNMGLMDQAKALEWIQKNIHYFGGDPNLVTLFGHSSGSVAAGLHFMNPITGKLFKHVILTGALPFNNAYSRSDSLSLSKSSADALGCSFSLEEKEKMLVCLREKDPVEIMTQMIALSDRGVVLAPVLDGLYIPENLMQHFEEMLPDEKSILVGNTKEEGAANMLMYFPEKEVSENTTFTLRDQTLLINKSLRYPPDPLVKVFRHQYTDSTNSNVVPEPGKIREEMVQFSTDVLYLCNSVEFLQVASSLGHTTYQMVFAHRELKSDLLPSWAGTFHGEELQFIFGRPLNISFGFTTEEVLLSRRTMRYFANFAKYGDPNSDTDELELSMPHWPAYSPKRAYLLLGLEPVVERDLSGRRCMLLQAFPELAEAFRQDKTQHDEL